MKTFTRHLDTRLLTPEALASHPWFRDLLQLWRPAGTPTEEVNDEIAMLRLAIRGGYVNFYCGGQSVAKVKFGKERFVGEIHHKYLPGSTPSDPSYVKTTQPQWNGTRGNVADWMEATAKHQGDEKKFVERIVAANANVIDLEMALPAQEGSRSATRMDIVALERLGDGWQVVFWEAKMVSNPEARSTGIPRVIAHQRKNYLDWLAKDGAIECVLEAYRNTCCLLVELHKFVKNQGWPIAPLGDGIVAVAAKRELLTGVDCGIRLVIDNEAADKNFEAKHLPRLLGIGETAFDWMPVFMVDKGVVPELPPLERLVEFKHGFHA